MNRIALQEGSTPQCKDGRVSRSVRGGYAAVQGRVHRIAEQEGSRPQCTTKVYTVRAVVYA